MLVPQLSWRWWTSQRPLLPSSPSSFVGATVCCGLLLTVSRPRCSSAATDQQNQHHHYSNLLRRCVRASSSSSSAAALLHGKAIHAKLLKAAVPSTTLFLLNHLLNLYLKCGDLRSGLHLFDEMPQKNVVSWTLIIAGFVHNGYPGDALSLFWHMHREGVKHNEFTFVSALQACSSCQSSYHVTRQIYALIVRSGFESNVFLLNAFLTALIRHNEWEEALQAFDNCLNKDIVSWNVMIAGYMQLCCNSEVLGFLCRMNYEGIKPDNFTFASILAALAVLSDAKLGMQVHAQLVKSGHGSEMCVRNSLVDMYMKNLNFNDGYKAFEEIPSTDVWSWAQLAAGCISCGKPKEALEVIEEMRKKSVRPNKFTLATALNACANLSSLEEGKKIHGLRIKLGDEDADVCVDNALLDMYAKCGCMDGAAEVFQSMDDRSVVSWTAMMMGYAQNGHARKALEIFDEMTLAGVQPNHVTFICLLYACSQGGFIDEGLKHFSSMSRKYGVSPAEDHYTCMVDLLGRAGRIKEAEELIQRMPFRAGALIWQTLLGACQVHGDTETAVRAAEHALDLDKEDPSTYVLASNMLAGLSNWDGVGMLRELMETRDVKKIPASSWVEMNGNHLLPRAHG